MDQEGVGAAFFEPPAIKHRLHEDVLAILVGTVLVALGLAFYTEALLVTGSVAGLSLVFQYATGVSFGVWFFLINLPFFLLAIRRMGWAFAGRTLASVLLVSAFSLLTPQWLDVSRVEPLYASLVGGALMGLGMLVLFRHRSSLGGVSILALYLQDNFGWRAGYFQLAVDAAVLAAAFLAVPWDRVLISLLGAAALNLIVAMNHKPGRYLGFS